ncbi:hypothetical protein MTR_3g080790 [Medicago truncatula]|uniref:Uncharacterized protein n=1 Tax=Medicago truncatula TaxID=3880 RepID=G7J7D7_MEDTR|nr:hypothetical protein MTR_3g080790 [Medicago truncatula]
MTFIFIFSYGVRVTSPELRAIVKHVSVASMEVVLMIMKDDIKEKMAPIISENGADLSVWRSTPT